MSEIEMFLNSLLIPISVKIINKLKIANYLFY